MTGTDTLRIHPSNAAQARAWDGDEGAYWAEHADRFDASVGRYHEGFLDAAAPAGADRVLDVGCGTGLTTRDAARRAPGGTALGVDLSGRMIALARRRAEEEGLAHAAFLQADAQVHPFAPGAFDLAISRTGAMFFGDPVAAFGNIARALRPGGRLVLLVWQQAARNEWFRALTTALTGGRGLPAPPPDAPSPFSLAEPERVRALLTAARFTAPVLEAREEPMRFGASAEDAFPFVVGLLGWMLQGLDDDARRGALDALRTSLAEHETPEGVLYGSRAWLVTAVRP